MTLSAYRSTMVRRWHTNPHLSHTVDHVGYHGGRMAVLAIMFWPGNADLIEACITHDLGEFASGDAPYEAKQYPPLKEALNEIADGWSVDNGLDMHLGLGVVNAKRLKFLDRADAYLWMMHYARRLRWNADWKEQRQWLMHEAIELEIGDKWLEIAVDAARV